jgi:general nucleoside transport system ATP-binding protein
VGNLPLRDNALMKCYYQAPVASGPFMRMHVAMQFTRGLLERFKVARATPATITRLLSGGQLQRFLLAREMALDPKVIVAVHPTRGLDVSATTAVQEWLVKARDTGAAILLISEDLDEVLQLSDRIAVIYEGRIVSTLSSAEADRERIGLMMVGSSQSELAGASA